MHPFCYECLDIWDQIRYMVCCFLSQNPPQTRISVVPLEFMCLASYARNSEMETSKGWGGVWVRSGWGLDSGMSRCRWGR